MSTSHRLRGSSKEHDDLRGTMHGGERSRRLHHVAPQEVLEALQGLRNEFAPDA